MTDKKGNPEDIEESGKTMAFDPQKKAPDKTEMTLTRSSLYPVRSRLPAFLRNPAVVAAISLVVLIIIVFGLLFFLGGCAELPDVPGFAETGAPDKEAAAWRVNGTAEAAAIPVGNIHSSFAIVVELDSMQAVAGKYMHNKMYPASMTKIMTFIVAYENISDHQKLLELTQDIKAKYPEGSRKGIDVGDFMTVEQCLYAMILESDTDAVLMLCRELGGEAAFAEKMNEKAQELGLKSTHFTNATGLHHDDHYTTACEMAEILAYAMQIPMFKSAACSPEYVTYLKYYKNGVLSDYRMTFFNTTLRGRFEENRVSVLLSAGGEVIGGKTGFTDEAAYCQAAIATDSDGKTYIAILAHAKTSENSAKDTRYVFNSYIN